MMAEVYIFGIIGLVVVALIILIISVIISEARRPNKAGSGEIAPGDSADYSLDKIKK